MKIIIADELVRCSSGASENEMPLPTNPSLEEVESPYHYISRSDDMTLSHFRCWPLRLRNHQACQRDTIHRYLMSPAKGNGRRQSRKEIAPLSLDPVEQGCSIGEMWAYAEQEAKRVFFGLQQGEHRPTIPVVQPPALPAQRLTAAEPYQGEARGTLLNWHIDAEMVFHLYLVSDNARGGEHLPVLCYSGMGIKAAFDAVQPGLTRYETIHVKPVKPLLAVIAHYHEQGFAARPQVVRHAMVQYKILRVDPRPRALNQPTCSVADEAFTENLPADNLTEEL